MNYRLPDEEYAVLDYIRSRSGTHIDHLKITFGPVAVTAVDHLYQYGLIDPDFPNEDIYYASDLGKAYRHELPDVSVSKQEEDKQKNIDKKQNHKKIGFKTAFPYIVGVSTILGTIIAFIMFLKSCS